MTTEIMKAADLTPEPETEPEPVGCLVVKTQLCGKKNCRCHILGERHGPYLWFVRYIRIEDREEDEELIQYKWKYLGRKMEKIITTFEEILGSPITTLMKDKIQDIIDEFERNPKNRKPSQKIKLNGTLGAEN
jgi:hypothetical protein